MKAILVENAKENGAIPIMTLQPPHLTRRQGQQGARLHLIQAATDHL